MFHTNCLVLGLVVFACTSADDSYNDGNYPLTVIPMCDGKLNEIWVNHNNGRVLFSTAVPVFRCNTTVKIRTNYTSRKPLMTITRMNCEGKIFISSRNNIFDSTCLTSVSVESKSDFLNITYNWPYTKPYPINVAALEFYYNDFGYCSSNDDTTDEDDDDDAAKEFRCSTRKCIDEVLKCDGKNNCGDWSDELLSSCGLSEGAIIAISVTGAVVALSFIVCIIGLCLSNAARRRKETGSRDVHSQSACSTAITDSVFFSAQGTPINDAGQFPILAPPPYSPGNPYVNVFMAPGATADTDQQGASAPYDNVEPPKYEEIPLS